MGGGGGPGDGARKGHGGGQGQGQPQVLQTYGGRAADGRPEEGQRETRLETKGDQHFNIFSVYFLPLSTDSIFLTSMILLAPSGAQGITTLVLSYSLICQELKVFIFLAQVSHSKVFLRSF